MKRRENQKFKKNKRGSKDFILKNLHSNYNLCIIQIKLLLVFTHESCSPVIQAV